MKKLCWMMTCCVVCGLAEAASPKAEWGPPYRVVYGGYSMEPGDWDLWDGVFNLVHHSLLGRDATETRRLLDTAWRHGMKILTTAPIRDPKTGVVDTSKLTALVAHVGKHPALFGYVMEAAYRIPPAEQKKIYDAIKKIDPAHPVWMEFSSTSSKTWKLFNPDACDAIFTYNYPYEVQDRPGSNTVGRVRYSVRAVRAANRRHLPVIPLVQTFAGTRWRKIPPGGVADQFDLWLELDTIAGIGFYRWRGRSDGAYAGLLTDGTKDQYSWKETRTICHQLARQKGPFVDAEQWRRLAGRVEKPKHARSIPAARPPSVAKPPRQPANTPDAFEGVSMLLDQDWEDVAVGTTPPADWNRRGGTVAAGGAMGTGHAVKVEKGIAWRLEKPTPPTAAIRLTFAIKPLEKGYAKGMITLSDARTGYLAVGLRLGHGTAVNSNVFSALDAKGKWRSLGIPFVPDHWYRVVIIVGTEGDKVSYHIEDLQTKKSFQRSLERRFPHSGFAALDVSADHARAVVVDEIRLESGRCAPVAEKSPNP